MSFSLVHSLFAFIGTKVHITQYTVHSTQCIIYSTYIVGGVIKTLKRLFIYNMHIRGLGFWAVFRKPRFSHSSSFISYILYAYTAPPIPYPISYPIPLRRRKTPLSDYGVPNSSAYLHMSYKVYLYMLSHQNRGPWVVPNMPAATITFTTRRTAGSCCVVTLRGGV
jgi:hypothetical protein